LHLPLVHDWKQHGQSPSLPQPQTFPVRHLPPYPELPQLSSLPLHPHVVPSHLLPWSALSQSPSTPHPHTPLRHLPPPGAFEQSTHAAPASPHVESPTAAHVPWLQQEPCPQGPSVPPPQLPLQLPSLPHVGLCPPHVVQAMPSLPHAKLARPATHTLPLQQPPLHVRLPVHVVVQTFPLHAYPVGQSVWLLHPQVLPTHAAPSGDELQSCFWVQPHEVPTHEVPSGLDVQSAQLPGLPQLGAVPRHGVDDSGGVTVSAGASIGAPVSTGVLVSVDASRPGPPESVPGIVESSPGEDESPGPTTIPSPVETSTPAPASPPDAPRPALLNPHDASRTHNAPGRRTRAAFTPPPWAILGGTSSGESATGAWPTA
jgi:hypothetical protein